MEQKTENKTSLPNKRTLTVEKSDSGFCLAPFTLLYIDGQNKHRICPFCIPDKNDQVVTSQTHIINDLWQGQQMQNLRSAMLQKKEIPACKACIEQTHSPRNYVNESLLKLIPDFEPEIEGGNQYKRPLKIHITPSSRCSLRCRYCDKKNSSSTYQEYQDHPELGGLIGHAYNHIPHEDLLSHESLLEQFTQIAIRAEILRLDGGEPLESQGTEKLLRNILEKDPEPSTKLELITSLEGATESFLQLASQFETEYHVSIDGIGPVHDYIRFPSKWENTNKTLQNLLNRQAKKIHIQINTLVNIYNILYLPGILDFWADQKDPHKRKQGIYFNILEYPKFQKITMLPEIVRHELATMFDSRPPDLFSHNLADVSYALFTMAKPPQELFEQFLLSTTLYDSLRNQNLKKDLYGLYSFFGNDFLQFSKETEIEQRPYLYFEWSIIDKCNLNCHYCLLRGVKSGTKYSGQDTYINGIEIAIAKKILSLSPYAKQVKVNLTGGEPLATPNIDKVLEILFSDPKIQVTMNTNFIGIKRIERFLPSFASIVLSTHLQCRSDEEIESLIEDIKKYTPIIHRDNTSNLFFNIVDWNITNREEKYIERIKEIIGPFFFKMDYVPPLFEQKDNSENTEPSSQDNHISFIQEAPLSNKEDRYQKMEEYGYVSSEGKRCGVGSHIFMINPDGDLQYDFCDMENSCKSVSIFNITSHNFNNYFKEDMIKCRMRHCHCNYNLNDHQKYLELCKLHNYQDEEIFTKDFLSKQNRT